MAGDEVMLTSAARGMASLRFYGWREATVSLGYFQATSCRHTTLRGLPFVRRPTGGGMLVHHHELTYALALPGQWLQGRDSWLVRMHQIIATALRSVGIDVRQEGQCAPPPAAEALCFRRWSCGDLTVAGHKVVGSAQRKQRQGLLQHGAVLLQASPHVPHLRGIREHGDRAVSEDVLQAKIAREFEQVTGWKVSIGAWTSEESGSRDRLMCERYENPAWNDRRS